MEIKSFYCLDKLKICYDASITIADTLAEDGRIVLDDYVIHITTRNNAKIAGIIQIPFNDHNPFTVDVADIEFDLSYATSMTDTVYCFLTFKNPFLYRFHHNYNIKNVLHDIEMLLDLRLRSISSCEVALDVNFCASEYLLSSIRDLNLRLFVLGREKKSPLDTIDTIAYELRGSRIDFNRMHIRVRANDNRYQFYVYDKLQACYAQNKEYILDHHGIHEGTLYRMECRFTKEQAENYCKHFSCSLLELIDYYLFSQEGLEELWDYSSKCYLRFADATSTSRRGRTKRFNPFEVCLKQIEAGVAAPALNTLTFNTTPSGAAPDVLNSMGVKLHADSSNNSNNINPTFKKNNLSLRLKCRFNRAKRKCNFTKKKNKKHRK